MMIRQSIGHGFANLANFAGRDRPGTFWPFASLLLGLTMLAWFVAVGWQLAQAFEKMKRFAEEHPDQVTVSRGPGHYSMEVHGYQPDLAPDFGWLIGVMAGLCLILALLVAAAVVRRLHDSNVGAWAALPPPILLFSGLWLMDGMFDSFGGPREPNADNLAGPFLLGFANDLLYLASLGVLIYQLARRGTPGPNRYGPAPNSSS